MWCKSCGVRMTVVSVKIGGVWVGGVKMGGVWMGV